MAEIDQVEIKALKPDLLQDYLAFFDQDAFVDNPHWASCYCYFNHAPHQTEDWEKRTGAQNRADVSALIQTGGMQGYLAYVNGKPVGWCNANLRANYTTLDPDQPPPGEKVGAIVCFIIAQPYRRRGLAKRLLEAALEGFRRQEVDVVEAFPRKAPVSEASNYHGPLSMYLDAGFEPSGEQDGALIVRKRL